VESSLHYTEVLRKLGLRPAGGNHKTLRHWVDEVWKIPTDHFDPDRHLRLRARDRTLPLDEVLVEHSTYNRRTLKRRLYDGGLKERRCELCGQEEIWRDQFMGLILDHINGVPDDNRLENLRIVCPNCNATLDTHCGRKNRSRRSCGSALSVGVSSLRNSPRSGTAHAFAGAARPGPGIRTLNVGRWSARPTTS
jgi:HNH endonuclease